jgi:hypothetical protein
MGRSFNSTYAKASFTAQSFGALSMAGWIYMTQAMTSAACALITLGDTTLEHYAGWALIEDGSNFTTRGYINGGTGEGDGNGSLVLSPGKWILGAVTWNGSTLTSYTNGGNAATESISISGGLTVNVVALAATCIEGAFDNQPNVPAYVGECAIWNVALTANEIADLWYSRRPMNAYRPSSLWGYWPLRGGAGNSEPDLSVNRNNLTLVTKVPPAPDPPIMRPRKLPSGYVAPVAPSLIPITPPLNSSFRVWEWFKGDSALDYLDRPAS